jgi:glycosyltransferase involved in cell wall biosynthesis
MPSRKKRIGILFHKNPFVSPTGIDQTRLRAISSGLVKLGFDIEIVAPVSVSAVLDNDIIVRPLNFLKQTGRYDLVKTSYHGSIKYLDSYNGPVVSRIVRVVDDSLPERDESNREELLLLQQIIKQRASIVTVNNEENRERWRHFYGEPPRVELVPTGCPAMIPPPGVNPFDDSRKNILFLGSLAAPRMVEMLNQAASRLKNIAITHLIGLNKACMYGGDDSCALEAGIVNHGEIPETEIWNYIFHADLGLAFSTGPHPFDNDVSKIFNYLRGGLPVVSEAPIINNALIRQTGFGDIFDHGDVDGLVEAAKAVLKSPMKAGRESVMRFMASEHSWDRRARVYAGIFDELPTGN